MNEDLKQTFINLCEVLKEVWRKIKKIIISTSKVFIDYIYTLEPRRRYKLLKSIGIKNYIPFFKRETFQCRNNC